MTVAAETKTTFKTFTSSAERPRIAEAVEVILNRIAAGEATTAIVKPPRTGKSNVIRLAAIEGLATGLIAGAVVLAPWLALRKQIVAPGKVEEMVQQFKVVGNISVTQWETRTVTTDFLRSTPCHLHSFTLAAACRPTCLEILSATARYCREVLNKPLVVFIDEGHTVAGKDGWGDLAIQLCLAGAHIVLLTGTPERSDNLTPFGFRTIEKTIATDVKYTTFGPRVGDQRMIQERRADRIGYRLDPDFEMLLGEAWDADIICRLRARWISCKINGVDLRDVEDDELRAVVEDPGVIEKAVDVLLDEVAIRRNNKAHAKCAFMVYVGSDTQDSETKDAHALMVLNILRAKWQTRFKSKGLIELATLNQNDEGIKAADVIQRFIDGHSDGLVVKQMGGVGLDVKQVKVLLDLSTIRTSGNTTQRWLRGATMWDHDIRYCTLILPETKKTRALYKRIVEDQGGDITKLVNSEVIDEWPADPSGDDDDLLISDADTSGASEMYEDFTREETNTILLVIRAYPQLGKLSFPDIQALIEAGGVIVPNEDEPEQGDYKETVVNVGDAAQTLRKHVNDAADDLTNRAHIYSKDNPAPWVNARRVWMSRAKEAAGIRTKLTKCQDLHRLQLALTFLRTHQ